MHRFLPLLLNITFSLCLSAVTIKDAYTRQMETEQFQRLSEFFTGDENPGNAAIFRSQEEERDGLYFFVHLSEKLENETTDHQFQLEVIRSDGLKPLEYSFELSGEGYARKKQLLLGLTGEDWPSTDLQPMAWRLKLLAGETEIAQWRSFLWEMP